MLQETISQGIYHTHFWSPLYTLVPELTLGDSSHLSDGTPNQKRIAIEPHPNREKCKNNRKNENKNVKKLLVNRISVIIQSKSQAKSEGSFKA